MTAVIALLACASLNQRSNPLLPTCYLHSLCEDVRMPQKKGLKGLWEEEACPWRCMHGRLFTAAPLAFAYASASFLRVLSLCSFSWTLCWEASPSAGGRGLENRARSYHWHTGRPFSKVPSKPLKINHIPEVVIWGPKQGYFEMWIEYGGRDWHQSSSVPRGSCW
jgi:hypothetical protein